VTSTTTDDTESVQEQSPSGEGSGSDGSSDPGGVAPADEQSRDTSHLIRNEGLVSDAEMRIDVAKNYNRTVLGDEDVQLKSSVFGTNADMTLVRGARARSAGSYEHVTHSDMLMTIGSSVNETVGGGVHLMARISAESMVGAAYANTIAGAYLRFAAWVDMMAWGGWVEADMSRAELSLLMIRSHMGYAHAAGVRATVAARLVDDFQARTENFGTLSITGATYQEAGSPGAGTYNES
jgi:hypothetical protein